MNSEIIHSLFTLFSGEDDSHAFAPLITTAVQEVRQQLQEHADETDVRLCYLAGAIANLRYVQIYAVRDYPMATYAGNIARQADGSQKLLFAERLVKAYQGFCADLLKDKDFVFFSVGGGGCEHSV